MNRKYILLVALVACLAILYNSCKEPEPTGPGGGTPSTTATLTGTVRDVTQPTLSVSGATVALSQPPRSTTTATDGSFTLTVDLGDTVTVSGTLTFSKTGYRQKVQTVWLQPGKTNPLGDITIQRDTTTGVGGGGTTYANTIAFIGTSTTQLSVRGVGGTETAIVTYEARDSTGFPIDIDHRGTISFSLLGAAAAPGGGAYVSPETVSTNAAGRAAVAVNSGTISGALQIVAKMPRKNTTDTIRSEPVRLIVSGGLPDQSHFSIAASPLNVPGLTLNGRTSTISIIAGDRYGNPVSTGTAVHFSTRIGVITTNTGFTDPNGFATVTLFSGNPRTQTGQPNGFGYAIATTVGENGATVIDSVRMLFSGPPSVITYTGPDTFTIGRGGSISFTFTVPDINGNPLTSGTTISLRVTSPSQVTVDPAITMPDVQSNISFTLGFSDVIEDPTDPVGGPVRVDVVVNWLGLFYSRTIATGRIL